MTQLLKPDYDKGGGFPCLLKAFTLGKSDSWASSISALAPASFHPKKGVSWLSLGRERSRPSCHSNFVIDLGEMLGPGPGSGAGSSKAGLT